MKNDNNITSGMMLAKYQRMRHTNIKLETFKTVVLVGIVALFLHLISVLVRTW